MRRVDLSDIKTPEELRSFADTLVTHAVFGALGGLVGYYDEDMLWLSHPEEAWVAVISETVLERFDEALAVVEKGGIPLDDLYHQLRGDVSWNGCEPLIHLLEYRRRLAGRSNEVPGSYFDREYDHLFPPGQPLRLEEMAFCLRRSDEQLLRGLIEAIAGCHTLIAGSGHPAVKSYERVNADRIRSEAARRHSLSEVSPRSGSSE